MLSKFLEDLFDNGRVQVSAPGSSRVEDTIAIEGMLKQTEARWRMSLPSAVPAFQADIARWAAEQLYHAAQCLVHRETEETTIQHLLKPRVPQSDKPGDHYSADMCLRFMKDVLRLSNAASETDPLNQQILEFMKNWPLSAVGMDVTTSPSCVLEHDSLRLMYLNRVIACNDRNALSDPETANAIQQLAGLHADLLPA